MSEEFDAGTKFGKSIATPLSVGFALFAMRYPAAGLAYLVRRIAPPVLEQYYLPLVLQAMGNGFL